MTCEQGHLRLLWGGGRNWSATALPSRYLVSEPLLVSEYHQTRLAALAKVAEVDAVTVMCDGWSNIRHEPIINFTLNVPQSVFWKSTHTELESHTGEYIAKKVSKVIQEVKQECRKMTVAVVTDNARNMKKAWKLLAWKHPELTCYGCAAHNLNLVFSDLLQLVTSKQVKNQAKIIVKEFISKHMLVDSLKNMQQLENVNTTLKLPVKTRWGSVLTCLESVQQNKLVLRKLAVSEISEKDMSLQVKKAILDDDFSMLSKATVKFLTPLHCIQLEADVPNLAEVFQLYSKVRIGMMENIETIPLIEGEQETIAIILDTRENFCIKMVHKSAYFLDPRYHGELLSNEDKLAAV